MSAKCNYSGVRKERQQAAIEKHTPNMFKAFVETYQQTKSKQEAIKAAEKICPSPFALNKVLYMLPRDLNRLIPVTTAAPAAAATAHA